MRSFSNVVGFDDAPFEKSHRGDVLVVGAIFTRTRLDGVVSTKIRRDGSNATQRVAEALLSSPFEEHVQAIMLQGLALGGFNVVDIHELAAITKRPVIIVMRKKPVENRMTNALEKLRDNQTIRGGDRKIALIRNAGTAVQYGDLYVQAAKIEPDEIRGLLKNTTLTGNIPEPLRLAHIIAGGVVRGVSRGRA